MGAIVGTKVYQGELGGQHRLLVITAPVAASSDTITLTEATHGLTEIIAILGATITGGADAAFQSIQASFSGLVVTVASFNEAGTAATDFTGTTVTIVLLVK